MYIWQIWKLLTKKLYLSNFFWDNMQIICMKTTIFHCWYHVTSWGADRKVIDFVVNSANIKYQLTWINVDKSNYSILTEDT